MNYKIGQHVNVMSWGSPERRIILELDKKSGKFKVGYDKAPGSAYYTPQELDEHEIRVRRYYFEQSQINDLGPTGHGPDICYSDADNGL